MQLIASTTWSLVWHLHLNGNEHEINSHLLSKLPKSNWKTCCTMETPNSKYDHRNTTTTRIRYEPSAQTSCLRKWLRSQEVNCNGHKTTPMTQSTDVLEFEWPAVCHWIVIFVFKHGFHMPCSTTWSCLHVATSQHLKKTKSTIMHLASPPNETSHLLLHLCGVNLQDCLAAVTLPSHGNGNWNLMEVSRLRSGRQSKKKKKTTNSMQQKPLSARGELQSHPLDGQAQACGQTTQVDGPGGPMAPVVATG